MGIDIAEFMIPLVLEIENQGAKPSMVRFDFSNEDAEDFLLLKKTFPKNSTEEIYNAINVAKANEYLEAVYIGSPNTLKMTTKGFYAGKSKQSSTKEKQARSLVKKLSDLVEQHNGILILYASIGSTISLVLSLLSYMHGN